MKKLILAAALLSGCSMQYVDEIKTAAPSAFAQAGFQIVGYEGYQWSSLDTYGGRVWYTLKRIPDNGVTYHAFLSKWGTEYHIYKLEAIDALKGSR